MSAVLLVESNAEHLQVARTLLLGAGHELLVAAGRDEALHFIARFDVGLVLLDGALVDAAFVREMAKGGLAAPRAIITFDRNLGQTMSGLLDAGGGFEDPEGVRILGFVEKPFIADTLLAIVEEGRMAAAPRVQVAALIDAGEDTGDLPSDFLSEDDEETQVAQIPGALFRALGLHIDASNRPKKVAADSGEPSPRALWFAEKIAVSFADRRPIDPIEMDALVAACHDAIVEDERLARDRIAAQGSLSSIPAFSVLQLSEGLDGPIKITFWADRARIEVFVDGHDVVFARQSALPETYRLGRFLIDLGKVDEQDIEDAVEAQDAWPVGERLVRSGQIEEEDLRNALIHQTEELVYEALCWSEGRFEIATPVEVPEPAQRAGVRLPLQGLLLEGMHRIDEWRRMTQSIGGLAAVVRRRGLQEPGDLPANARSLLSAIDGAMSVRELAEAAKRRPFDVVREVHLLHEQSLVTLH